MPKKKLGTVYLIHFDKKYHHAGHYVGFTQADNPDERLAEHLANRGSRLLQVVNAAGIVWRLARHWPGTRSMERRIKNSKNATRLCPICTEKPRSPQCKKPKRKRSNHASSQA